MKENIPEEIVREDREDMASGIFGLKEENFHISDLIRGFVSGMAGELYGLYQDLPEELRSGKTGIIASGNGIRKNPLLKEEIEKIYKLPAAFTDRKEEAATRCGNLGRDIDQKQKRLRIRQGGSHEK